jgi:predicted transcriptional regulator
VPRPPFEPSDEQRRLLGEIEEVAKERRRIADELEEVDTKADVLIARAEKLKVPIDWIARAAGRTRKTVYRHLGKPMK